MRLARAPGVTFPRRRTNRLPADRLRTMPSTPITPVEDGLIRLQGGYWDKLSFLRAHGLPIE